MSMARPSGMPFSSTPIARPPTMFTNVMITLATASPATNRLAPSMLAKKSACRWSSSRMPRASSRLSVPCWTSVSIAICRPGSPSSANRAATSLVRVEPAVITTNCTTAMIAKITAPTTMLLAATNSPKASTTRPAAAVPSIAARERISRVVAMLRTSRTSVAPRRNVGKMQQHGHRNGEVDERGGDGTAQGRARRECLGHWSFLAGGAIGRCPRLRGGDGSGARNAGPDRSPRRKKLHSPAGRSGFSPLRRPPPLLAAHRP